jgi:hypothetical protein
MMKLRTFWSAFLIAGCMFPASGAPSSIGIVRSYGEFRVDGAAVRGNSTLVAGDVVETMAMNTTVNLGATEITLLPESRAALYSNHTTLQRGTTLLRGASSHALEAGNLRIVGTSPHSLVQVGYSDRKLITISAHAGAANVFTSSGELLASLNPGGSLAFEPASGASGLGSGQATANAGATVKGKLTKKNGAYFVISDDGKTYEITSTTVNLDQYVGKVVTAAGSVVSSSGGVTVVTVASVSVASVAAGAGLSAGAVTAIVVGGAAAGTLGGLAAAGSFSGKSASVP